MTGLELLACRIALRKRRTTTAAPSPLLAPPYTAPGTPGTGTPGTIPALRCDSRSSLHSADSFTSAQLSAALSHSCPRVELLEQQRLLEPTAADVMLYSEEGEAGGC
jgi:hypothetical protein